MRQIAAVWLIAFTQTVGAQPARPTRSDLRAILVDKLAWANQSSLDSIFYHETGLRPLLRSMLRDPKAHENALKMLALIGEPEDLQLLVRQASKPNPAPFANRWAYWVAAALLEPASDAEWNFLRRCALGEYDDRWVDAGAILTLQLTASPRSIEILKKVQQRNPYGQKWAVRAINYIQSNPSALTGDDLEGLAVRVANVIRIGQLQNGLRVRYNQSGKKALVQWIYTTGEDRLTYTGTFQEVAGQWRLHGLRETLQEFFISTLR